MSVGVGTSVIVPRFSSADQWEFLMLRRAGKHGAGTWAVPGGWWDEGEDRFAAARREFFEEVGGVKIDGLSELHIQTDDNFVGEGVHCLTLWFVAAYHSGEPTILEPEKATDIGWFQWGDWPGELFLPMKNLVRECGDIPPWL